MPVAEARALRRAGRAGRPLDPLAGADRRRLRGRGRRAARPDQRRPGLGDADEGGAAGGRPRADRARGRGTRRSPGSRSAASTPDNVGEVVAAGASRAVVVRAIRDAADPEAAARALAQRSRRRRSDGRTASESGPSGGSARSAASHRAGRARESAASGWRPGPRRRTSAAREALEPLAEGERPTVVTVGAVISALICRLDRDRLRGRGRGRRRAAERRPGGRARP